MVTSDSLPERDESGADPRISEAIVIWTGFGRTAWPAREDLEVEQHFGDVAPALMRSVRSLADAFDQSDARHRAVDLADLARRAAADFRAVHPEISEEAIQALAWCYAFDNR
jgi:hypothetical protein